jgi:hypothetical protein
LWRSTSRRQPSLSLRHQRINDLGIGVPEVAAGEHLRDWFAGQLEEPLEVVAVDQSEVGPAVDAQVPEQLVVVVHAFLSNVIERCQSARGRLQSLPFSPSYTTVTGYCSGLVVSRLVSSFTV